jgi:hypothetical protein
MLPLALTGLVIIVGIVRMHYADQPPPLAREFYRPHWEWERTNPMGRPLRAAKTCIAVLFAVSATLVFSLAFLGISLPGL